MYADDLEGSTLFDGSEYSLSGNGAKINESDIIIGQNLTFPRGSGGGCVTTGPFANYTAPMGPFSFALALENTNGSLPAGAFNYTPHCFSRDLNAYAAQIFTNYSCIADLMAQPTLDGFQNALSVPPGTFQFGVHGGGHLTLGGQGTDFFASPSDPAFYLHHSMVDRVWSLWQAMDPENRQYALYGTQTMLDKPPSANLTVNDYLTWGDIGESLKVEGMMRIDAGPYCYRYE
jgi:tyrosinase